MSLDQFAHKRPDVLRLRSADVPFRQIGAQLGISTTTAWRLADPDHERRFQQSTADSASRRAKAAA